MKTVPAYPEAAHSILLRHKYLIFSVSFTAVVLSTVLLISLLRLVSILAKPRPQNRPPASECPTHLLVVLGSGGHTAEMLNILSSVPDLRRKFIQRTYLISSGDGFSALKAKEFEEHSDFGPDGVTSYSIVTVRRARRVHQSFLTAPATALLSLWDCLKVLCGTHSDLRGKAVTYPDLVLTNGPGTGVCVVIAVLILHFFGMSKPLRDGHSGQGQMRTVFIESWARVRTLSLSGKILKPLVNRFLVQWPHLADSESEITYFGPLVS